MSISDITLTFSQRGKPAVVVSKDQIDDTSTSLTLGPINDLNSDNIVNNNTLHLLEHFCGSTEPRKSTAGQLWVDTGSAPNEPDRLKVYMLQTPADFKYMDVGGTAISKTGTLRHTGQIEALNDYNNISQADKTTLPEASTYYKFLTTKRHCDENYLSGLTEEGSFIVRNNRKIIYNADLTYTAPLASPDADSATLVTRKFIDDNYLDGFNNPGNTFTITDNKPLYYAVNGVPTDRVPLHDYELVTAGYVKSVNDILFNDYAGAMQALLARLAAAEAKANAARASAIAAYNAFKNLPPPTTPTVVTINGAGGTLTRTDTTLPTVTSYNGTRVPTTITGTITDLTALNTGATFEVKVGTTVICTGVTVTDISKGITVNGNIWLLDPAGLAWTVPVSGTTKYTVTVTRTEADGTTYTSVGVDNIQISAAVAQQVPTIEPATGTTTLPIQVTDIDNITINGTVGTDPLSTDETFAVTVKKVGAAVGLTIPPANLVVTGNTWTLLLPMLELGTTYDVNATRTNTVTLHGVGDTTSGELVVTTPATVAAPTLDPLVTSRKWPEITGTVGTIPIPEGKDFKVTINSLEYTTVLDATRLKWSVKLDTSVPAQKLPLGSVNVIVKRFGKQSSVRVINVVDYLRVYNPSTMHSAAYMNYSLKFLEEDLKVGYYMYTVPDALKVKITQNGVTTVLAQTEKDGVYSKVSWGYPSPITKVSTTANARKYMHYFTISKDLISDDVVLGIYINEGDAVGADTDFEYVLQVAGDLQPISGKVLKQGKSSSVQTNWVDLVLGAYTINLDGSVTSL